jgi:gamma-glutamyl:cysteine ligase YbdK (ATP-grasp superfamily)
MAYPLLARATPYARELGCGDALQGIDRILREGTGADLQRKIYGDAGMPGLLAWLRDQREART